MVQLPKFTSSRVRSVVESEGKAYLDLAAAYCTHNADKLHRCVEQYSAAYTAVRAQSYSASCVVGKEHETGV